jgi:hypothetical protein
MTYTQIENAVRGSIVEFVRNDTDWKWLCAAGYNPVHQTGFAHLMRKDLNALPEVRNCRPQSIDGIKLVS